MGERRHLGEGEVLVSRRVWDQLRDALYRLQTASEDVAMDVALGSTTKSGYVDALAHLTEAVRELQDVSVEPIALRDDDAN